MTSKSHILGGLYGSLVGDALGVPVEFKSRADRVLDPVIDMRDYGTHGQPKGTWSDDGALLLCSAESLALKGFDLQDMGERFVRWYGLGHWAARGLVFDIGNATRGALRLIEHGCPAELAGGAEDYSNGNGSLMRILPVALASLSEADGVFADRISRASAITHQHSRSKLACVMHGLVVRGLMRGLDADTAIGQARESFRSLYQSHDQFFHFAAVMDPTLHQSAESTIRSDGYVIHTLTASLWCLLTTSSYAECVLKAVNLGDDTDTTGCVAGGLAGLLYGVDAIPAEWKATLPRQQDLRELSEGFLRHTQ